MHRYRELKVWQESASLAVEIAECVRNFPASERFGIPVQLKRASVSVASNIAEGAGSSSTLDFKSFLSVANGSLFEVDTQLEICFRIGLIDQKLHPALLGRVSYIGNMIFKFHQYIDNESNKSKYGNEGEELYQINLSLNFINDKSVAGSTFNEHQTDHLKHDTKSEY